MKDSTTLREPLANERHITLRTQIELEEILPIMDASAMQQALVNLLDNAIKFSPPGTTVTVSLKRSEENEAFQLSVSDQGRGIAQADQRRIFERFYRSGSELRRETQGAGVGLSIVQHIVDAHHGTITLESGIDRGSTFTLTIPLWPAS